MAISRAEGVAQGRFRAEAMKGRAWDVEIESAEGLTDSGDVLEGFADALHLNSRALGSCASLNTRSRVLSASFSVLAADEVEAAAVGRAAFLQALESLRIRVPEQAISHLSVTLEPDEALTPTL
jgi:hypothetical protein